MNNPKKIKIWIFVFLGIVVFSYAGFQSKKLLSGPVIEIISPQNGSTFIQTLILVEGTAKNISYLSLNGRQIYTDKNGYFGEKFLLSPGYNVIKLEAEDKFKNHTEKKLELVLKEY